MMDDQLNEDERGAYCLGSTLWALDIFDCKDFCKD